jgi:glutamyl-tRNA reductase
MRVLNQLAIVNLRQDAREQFPVALNGLEWKTCLRRVLFLNRAENQALIEAAENQKQAAVEIYNREDAPKFLLEVICGLNSPLVGETAVMGQFREFLANAVFPNTSWGSFLRQLTSNLLADAKRVRHDHLQGLGSQTYGSLVRQQVRGLPVVSVVGAGQLAREILPWLIGKTKVKLFHRNWDHAKELLNEYPEIELVRFSDAAANGRPEGMGLVIAAPLSAVAVENWVRQQGSVFSKCLDLRGEAETDPLSLSFSVIKLSELFDALRNDRQKLEGRVAAARAEIDRLSQRQMQHAQFRPFGWEDLCA